MADLKKVSQGARNSAFLRWIYGNLTCFSQEHMQTFGYLAAMLPVVDELYDTDAEKVQALSTYRTFFNTEPQIGTMVVGLTVGLEEARANGEPLDDDTINGIRAGLMGPLAGLGDSIIVGTFIPILLATPSSSAPSSPSCSASPSASPPAAACSARCSMSSPGTWPCTSA